MAALVLALTATAAGDPLDDEALEDVPLPEPDWQINEATVLGRVFGEGTDREAGHVQLDTLLRQRIAIVDHICHLTENQKRKLQLAGRGDSKRLFDRIDEIGSRIELAGDDREKAYELLEMAHSLQHDFIKPGFSGDGSMFMKSLEQLLTEEQAVKYAPLRALIRAGGLVRVRRGEEKELLEITLPETASVDDVLARLRELPSLRVLVLSKTQVTNAGLVHLAGLAGLHTLILNRTRVTDEGLAELKGLTDLHELVLDETHLTDAGLEHLKGLTSLRHLSCKGTRVTDGGVFQLKGLVRLESLVLDETDVTEAGLVHLKGLAGLQMLLVRRTHVTNAGITELQRTSPRLAIHK
jgi:hypothetical protein